MIKKMLVVFSLFGIVCSFTSFVVYQKNQKPAKLRTIIIDPGHGGADHGTHGLISTEKDVTLDISLKLGRAIQQEFPEIKVVFTRTSDELPGGGTDFRPALLVRADIANKAKGDLFICIHGNSNGKPAGGYYAKRVIGHKKAIRYIRKRKRTVTVPIYESYWVTNTRIGTETYIWKADRSGFKGTAISQTDEGEENMEDSTTTLFDLNSPEAKMRAQLYEKKYSNNSALFATLVEEEFKKAGRQSYGVKQRDEGIRVLQATGMPSVLIETGFLTNKEEEEYLNSDKGQDEIVGNIIDALKAYKEQLEAPRSTGTANNSPSDNK
jgi:N-acetylmuramoyl-L-alanine amidase